MSAIGLSALFAVCAPTHVCAHGSKDGKKSDKVFGSSIRKWKVMNRYRPARVGLVRMLPRPFDMELPTRGCTSP